VAGGYGQAEDLKELREVRFELVKRLPELPHALCATVAGGCGQAEALKELADVVFELVESLRNFGQTLSVTRGAAPIFPTRRVPSVAAERSDHERHVLRRFACARSGSRSRTGSRRRRRGR
jgi:hypothetical protein